jgi:hypothetical protein
LNLDFETGRMFTVACQPSVLNARLTELMKPLEMITKDEYFKRFPLLK